ncbi:MAG: glucose 1-dehydrogenase [Frankiales bacterium]|nr:glucose 1-dehydrogenase [Frankiales bacterium]
MQAMTVVPGKLDSAGVEEVPEPPESDGSILVNGLFVGICGTDVEIVKEGYGWAPPGRDRLTLFHESLGRVEEAPAQSGFASGDLVVGIVRRPDPVPCPPCAAGQWDFCKNGQYTERGIKERDGYGSQRWRIEPDYAVKLDPALGDLGVLLEPTTVVAKAWAQVDAALARVHDQPEKVLVTGAGPIGLLAALIGVQRGLEVHVVDRVTDGPKPQLVADLGATYHAKSVHELDLKFDVVIEATGVGQVVFDAMTTTMPNAVVVLTGISSGTRTIEAGVDAFNKAMVLTNEVVVGSVNAGRKDYVTGAEVLVRADPAWLARLITRRVPMAQWTSGLDREPDDVKVVVQIS